MFGMISLFLKENSYEYKYEWINAFNFFRKRYFQKCKKIPKKFKSLEKN